MNIGQAPQWEHMQDNDPQMELHPFFGKTKGFANNLIAALALAPVPNSVSSVLSPAPKVMVVPLINSLLVKIVKPMTDKGKQPIEGTWQSREDNSDIESTVKKCKASEGIIFVKQSKAVVPVTPASTRMLRQTLREKGKGKEKAVEIAKGNEYRPPCKSQLQGASDEVLCQVLWDEVNDDLPATTKQVWASNPQSKAMPASSKKQPQSMSTRVTSCAHQPMPDLESEDAMEVTKVTVAAEPINPPAAIVSANDFPPKHWQEEVDTIIPPPPAAANSTTSVVNPTIHDHLVALMVRVTAMEIEDHHILARVAAMEHDFNACISAMWAEFSAMQLDFSGTMDIVTSLVTIVEKL
ncbi:hypothetical protein BDR04DRAFT_1118142 [Suillus decipiens]|nr:hypothetical protein BDR04DRAFT_1118142 [Suillus decipiens]